jgi:nucleotide-binding universal stress UspA family protein
VFSRILVSLDGSKLAEQALPFARLLARTLKIPIELFQVVDLSSASVHMAADKALFLERLIAEAERRAREYLDGVARDLAGIDVAVSIERGKPAQAILARAAALPGALIAIATHGRSGINRWFLGSVAEKVLRGTAHPLFLVRATDRKPDERAVLVHSIIVPLDGSTLAETVLPAAGELAKVLNASVLLFRAFELPAKAYYGREDYLPDYDALKRRVKSEAEAYLEAQGAALKRAGLNRVSTLVREGLGADEIIRCARENPDSLVAMCTHGRSGFKRWVLGSVTEKVVRRSGDPVLVMRGKSQPTRASS